MAKNDGGLDYSKYYVKNYLKDSDASEKLYQQQIDYDEVPVSRITHIPRVTAMMPDEIDNVPYLKEPEYEREARKTVPYTGAREELPYNAKKRGINNKRRKKANYRKRGLMIVVLTIMICTTITLLIADSVSGGYIFDEMRAVFSGAKISDTYYAVQAGNFADAQTAKVFATQLSAIGGAGYVINDNGYRVIAEVYHEKKDADIIAARLATDGYESSVYTIEFNKFDYQSFPQTLRNNTKQVIEYIGITYRSLYNVGAGLAARKIDASGARSELKTLLASIRNILVDYESNADNDVDHDSVMKVRVQLNAAVAAIQNLLDDKMSNNDLLSNVRYTNAMLINTHRALCREFQII